MGSGYSHLSYGERLAIMDGRREGLSMRAIARMLGRDPATVSRELRREPWLSVGRYDACSAYFGAIRRRSRSRMGGRKLRLGCALFDTVAGHVREGWSPLQIAGRLGRMEADDRRRRVCHETIYLALYALPRGELRRELLACLRQGRQARRPRSRGSDRRSWVPNDLRIAARPEDIEERQIPGHWEGDLIKGAFNRSAVGTLVERSSRLVMLARLDATDAHAAQQGFERLFDQMPQGLRKTMTYDRGTEMTCHQELTRKTGVKIYFADPHSPWQRGSNENANGLIREYLPKGIDLSSYTQDDLDDIAYRLNSRPRKVLDFRTPREAYNEYLNATLAAEAAVALQD
jgi:IS30 family transposase